MFTPDERDALKSLKEAFAVRGPDDQADPEVWESLRCRCVQCSCDSILTIGDGYSCRQCLHGSHAVASQ